MQIKRLQATWSEDCSDLAYLKKKYTVTGTPKVVDTPYGKGLSFPGSSDVFSPTTLDIGTSFTYGTRFRVDTSVSATEVLMLYYDGTNRIGVELKVGGDSVNIFTSNSDYRIAETPDYDNGEFHTILYTWDGTSLTAYYDGVSVAVGISLDPSDVSITGLMMGKDSRGTRDYNGEMKDSFIDNRVWTQQEVTGFNNGTTFDYDQNLVTELDMSNTGVIKDVGWQNNNNYGTTTNMTTDNIKDNGLEFDGVSEKIDLNSVNGISVTEGTVSVWLSPNSSIALYDTVIQGYTGTTNSFSLQAYTNSGSDRKLLFATRNASGTTVNSTSDTYLPTNGDTHVAITWNATSQKTYINGVLEDDDARTGALDTLDSIRVGASFGGNYYDGCINNKIKIYDKDLTNTQIKDIVQGDKR